ncbi:hypothetical protein Lal_00031359 [Lupinus albus]|nr:hypothetical protein Lal_00031359 [Lupinus albus]
MSTITPQSKELAGLLEIKVATAASNSVLGHNDLCYVPEEQITRLAKFAGREITPTAYTNLSWMTDSGFMFPEFLKNQGLQAPRDMHHDDPTEVDLYLIIIEHTLMDVSDTGYLITDPQENFIMGQYIHFHMDIYKYDGMWIYFEDAEFYPESTKFPPPANNSDEESVAPPIKFHALDEANNDEAEEDDEEEEDPSENSDSD